jgi:outer membrane protein
LSKYNLAKDYNEDMIRRQTNLENTGRQKENSIQNYANSVQKKYQNNTYLTQEDQKNIQAEQQKIANMQSSAQREMEKLQADYTNAASQAQQAINDSIEAFIQEYNKKRGYDAIFFKAATLYIDPALDITDEVIEGLNARYNKMKK